MRRTLYIVVAVIYFYMLLSVTIVVSQPLLGRELTPKISMGGVLNLPGTDPETLDPALSPGGNSQQYIVQIFSGLVSLDDKMSPAPDIAKEWLVSEDGRTYTFTLRQDVKFHSGSKVSALDFKYSWERACNPKTDSNTAVTYLGDIVGVKDMLSGKSKEISGLRVIDDYTLEVTIDAPKFYFLAKLTYPTAFVVERANVERGGEWWRKPNGTGPFKLKQWDKSRLIVLERNGLYYGEVARVDSVVYQLYRGWPIDLYEKGTVDVAGVSTLHMDKVTDKAGPFYQDLRVVSELSFYYIGFNTSKPPFDDVNIRRAFSRAIDKSKLASLTFRDTMGVAKGILPPGMPGFNPELSGLDFNVAKAKELIAKSRYSDVSELPPITITVSGWGGIISQYLEAIIEEWRRNLGVEIKVRQLEPERFHFHLDEELDEMFDWGWMADYPHPQNFLDVLFHSGAYYNYGGYNSPEVDSLLERASIERDDKLILALYQEAEDKLVEDAACLPLWFGRSYYLVKPYVKGYVLTPLGFAALNQVSMENP